MSWILLIIAIAIPLILVLWQVSIYNGLVNMRNRYKNAFSQIDVQLKRRYDLIPNLVETAKGYMKHEEETLRQVIQARNQAAISEQEIAANPGDAGAQERLQNSEQMLTGAVNRFFALSEAYPDLKANQNMQQLTEELSSTENKIAFARQAFNDAIMQYNNHREQFPNIIFAQLFGFDEAAFFHLDNPGEERKNVNVSF